MEKLSRLLLGIQFPINIIENYLYKWKIMEHQCDLGNFYSGVPFANSR
jgi:hypothetical protein